MMADTVLKRKGMDVLSETLGLVDAERFIRVEGFNTQEPACAGEL
jgi:hypothetical protein